MKAANIVLGILTVLLGVYCLLRPGIAFVSAAWMLGVLLIFAGANIIIIQLRVEKKSVLGILKAAILIVVGILLLFNNFSALFADTVILYMIGIGFAVSGIIQIIWSVYAKKNGMSSWGWLMAAGILLVIGGIFAIAHPILTAISVGYCMAFSILCDGVDMLLQGMSDREETAD